MNVIPKCVPPKILHQRINHFTVNGQSQGAILEQYNKKMKKVAFSESEDSFAFSFASGGLDQLTKMRKKLFDVLGASDHQSSESPDMDYGADIDSVVKIMIGGKAFTIAENRSASDIKTADGEESLQNENSNILAMSNSVGMLVP
jgi:hypothetical protein